MESTVSYRALLHLLVTLKRIASLMHSFEKNMLLQ